MANALLVIGVHREEPAFGRAVVAFVTGRASTCWKSRKACRGDSPAPTSIYGGKPHREPYLQFYPTCASTA